MSDLITRARKEWCELQSLGEDYGYGCPESICPPVVVAALLDVLAAAAGADTCPACHAYRIYAHKRGCRVEKAQDIIDRALEGLE